MKLRTSVLAFAISVSCAAVWAQDSAPVGADSANDRAPEIYPNPILPPQKFFYKWHERGKTHYAKYAPRGISNYTKINEQGMVVNARPVNDSITVLKPMRPEAPAANPTAPPSKNAEGPAAAAAAAANSQQQPLPEGTITREKRCETAQTNLKTISEKKNIFEEDSSGNLIPLSSEEIEKRRQQAQNDAEHFCGPASPAAQ